MCPNCHSQTDTYTGKNNRKVIKLKNEKENDRRTEDINGAINSSVR